MDKELLSHVEIQWPGFDALRMRRVVSRSNHRVTGKYPSLKMGRSMHWESTLERDAFMLFEATPSILEYYEQPAKIHYALNGKALTHFPDALIITEDGAFFVEIKEQKDADDPDIKSRSALLSAKMPLSGYGYLVLTEREIRQQPRLDNARTLLRYGRLKPTAQFIEHIYREYLSSGTCQFGDIMNGAGRNADFPAACRMIIDGLLLIDLEKRWDDQTLVSRNAHARTL